MLPRFVSCIVLIAVLPLLFACTIKGGALRENSHFVHPNSNIQVLGPVKTTMTKYGVFGFGINFTAEEVRGMYRDALSQQQGANVIVNMAEDTSVTTVLIVSIATHTIEGDAAKAEVGRQQLR